YLPAISRFINQDIVFGNIAVGISLNRFAYANGDPINNNDPLGFAGNNFALPQINGPFLHLGPPDPLGVCRQPPNPLMADGVTKQLGENLGSMGDASDVGKGALELKHAALTASHLSTKGVGSLQGFAKGVGTAADRAELAVNVV